MRFPAILGALALTVPPAAALAAPASLIHPGRYEGRLEGGDGEATIRKAAGNSYLVDVTVAEKGCVGNAKGKARMIGTALVLQPRPLDALRENRQCRISFTPKGHALVVEEANCLGYHGSACGFSGTLQHKGK